MMCGRSVLVEPLDGWHSGDPFWSLAKKNYVGEYEAQNVVIVALT